MSIGTNEYDGKIVSLFGKQGVKIGGVFLKSVFDKKN